jgi:hypothetical protein
MSNLGDLQQNTLHVQGMYPTPEIKSNIQFTALEQLRKHLGTSHGMSLIAITMIDFNNRDLELDVLLESNMYLEAFVEHIINVWGNYIPVPSFIRSYQVEGKFLDEFEGVKLQDTTPFPGTNDQYKNKKFIIDIADGKDDDNEKTYTFKFYRWGEDRPRILRVSIAQSKQPMSYELISGK